MTESFAGQPWLSLITFAPLFGALCIIARRMMSRTDENGNVAAAEQAQIDNTARWVALGITTLTLLVSLGVYALYDPALSGYQLVEKYEWLGSGISNSQMSRIVDPRMTHARDRAPALFQMPYHMW